MLSECLLSAATLLVLTISPRILLVLVCVPPWLLCAFASSGLHLDLLWGTPLRHLEPHYQDVPRAGRSWGFISPRPFLSQWHSPWPQRRQTLRCKSYSQVSLWDELEAPQDCLKSPTAGLLLLPSSAACIPLHFSLHIFTKSVAHKSLTKVCFWGTQPKTSCKLFLETTCPWK